jgi:bacterioferritin-associated ferredoxin
VQDDQRERIVCACSRVTAREIDAAIAAGASTLDALGRRVDAGMGCRTCHPELRSMLAAAALRRLHAYGGLGADDPASPRHAASPVAPGPTRRSDARADGPVEGPAAPEQAPPLGFHLELVPSARGPSTRGRTARRRG